MPERVDGVHQAERYVYWSLHWGFPLLPLLGLLSWGAAFSPVRSLVWTLLLVVSGWCGLVVLHTGLRRRGDLGPSGWDALFLRRRTVPATVGWVLSSVLAAWMFAAALGPQTVHDGGPVPILLVALFAGIAASPGFGIGARRMTVPPFALAAVLVLLAAAGEGLPPAARGAVAVVGVVWAVALLSLTVMFLNLLMATKELDRARRDAARLAVDAERSRFSRDLHDVFGRTLSAVALKAELGAAQARRGRPEAADTMLEVQTIATDALTEVRALVRGYRQVDLAAEVGGARSLLEAAGIQVDTAVDAEDLPGPVGRAFGWVVREAATNVLRHSQATTARIVLSTDPAGTCLEVSNDAPHPPTAGGSGSGLAGLSERMSEVGGTLEHGLRAGRFVVSARVKADALERLRTAERSRR